MPLHQPLPTFLSSPQHHRLPAAPPDRHPPEDVQPVVIHSATLAPPAPHNYVLADVGACGRDGDGSCPAAPGRPTAKGRWDCDQHDSDGG